MAAAFAIQSGSSLSKGGEKKRKKAHLYIIWLWMAKKLYLCLALDGHLSG
jgi:hypothetical protein